MNFIVNDSRLSESPLVEIVWRTQSDSVGSFISLAASHWEMVLMKHQGKTTLAVRGAETKATPVSVPADAEWLGITFKLGAFMPHLSPGDLLDGCNRILPEAAGKSFWLGGSTWEFPTYENVDTFVKQLEREGLLVNDPAVAAVLQGFPQELSPRALQYRFVRATGLPHKVIQQIERARGAAELLQNGTSILDTVHQMGYFDQAHLTNSLKRFVGQTPAQLARIITVG